MAMTPTHVAVGMSIGLLVPNPAVSIPLAFVSHFLFDLYPEWGNSDKKVDRVDVACVLVEIFLGLYTVATLWTLGRWELWACAVAANLVDLCDFILERAVGRKVWFCHGGHFPLRVAWPSLAMNPWQTALLDAGFVIIMSGLALKIS
jgi:hypothetical protein